MIIGLTNNRLDYPAHKVTRPSRHQFPKYEAPEAHQFGMSTSQEDYGAKPLPQNARRVQPYTNSGLNMGFDVGVAPANQTSTYKGKIPRLISGGFILNGAKLDGVTSNRNDYQSWPVVHNPRHQQPKYQATTGTFMGTTTSQDSYSTKALPEHYVHHQAPYAKGTDKLDCSTTQGDSYQKWNVIAEPQRRNTQAPKKGAQSTINIGNRDL